jgi:hypothetical protein
VDSIWLWPLALVAVLFALPALRDLAARLAATRYRAQVRESALPTSSRSCTLVSHAGGTLARSPWPTTS